MPYKKDEKQKSPHIKAVSHHSDVKTGSKRHSRKATNVQNLNANRVTGKAASAIPASPQENLHRSWKKPGK